MSDPIPGAASEAVEQWNSRATTDTTIVPELVEALKQFVVFIRGVNTLSTRGAEIELSRLCRNGENALARASSLPAPVGDWNAAIEAAAKVVENSWPRLDGRVAVAIAIRRLARPSQEDGK